ncbi:hypothetical protein [Paenibacillus xerothermodurans]|uniref:Uncharacterized protein n=1 Tax=Paenibacillus xerothermodurans TaxID=1977292 RepID=A0A2W1ND57_PAEXE|nr:hypothetical protein [Paenibacillus xerothermodurans]PZE21021.1 hypothetical protein CBW46_010070 [Paenibacillus xerothermodurans]
MPVEAETLSMLTVGFSIVLLIGTVVFTALLVRTKSFGYIWFLLNIALLIAGYYFALDVLRGNTDVHPVLRSEANSLSIGLTAVFWGFSVLCTLIGVLHISHRTER